MRKNLAAVALLLSVWAAWSGPVQTAAQGSLRYTMELEDWRENAHRLELRTPAWRLLAVERGIGLEPEYLALGLACPWGVLGPLAPRGLLRGLADPWAGRRGARCSRKRPASAWKARWRAPPGAGFGWSRFPAAWACLRWACPRRARGAPERDCSAVLLGWCRWEGPPACAGRRAWWRPWPFAPCRRRARRAPPKRRRTGWMSSRPSPAGSWPTWPAACGWRGDLWPAAFWARPPAASGCLPGCSASAPWKRPARPGKLRD